MESATSPAATVRRGRPDPLIVLTVLAVLSLALLPVEINRAFGLPAHPLLIHFPVVAIPLLGLALVAVAVRPALLDRFGIAIAALAVASMASTILAAGAGDAFRENGEGGQGIAEHAEAGETLRLIMIGLVAVVLIALALRRAGFTWAWVAPATRILFLVGAVLATFFVIRTGHLGAQETWNEKGEEGERPPAGLAVPGGEAPPRDRDSDGD